MNRIAARLAALSFGLMPSLALAHPGHEGPSDLVHAFMHPLGGADYGLGFLGATALAGAMLLAGAM